MSDLKQAVIVAVALIVVMGLLTLAFGGIR